MKEINYLMPKTITETIDILSNTKESVSVVAGGTDLILEMNDKGDTIVDISKIKELKYIKCENDIVHIGAMTTFGEIENDTYLKDNVKAVWQAAYDFGSPQIRNLGTIGGNVVNASVAGDSPTAFIALDAKVLLKSKTRERVLNILDFNNENRQGSKIEKDELLVEVFFNAPNKNTKTSFAKLSKRDALAIVVVSTACLIEKDGNDICTRAHIVMGAVSPQPLRLTKIEEMLVSKKVSEEVLYETLDLYTEAVLSISNRPSAAYKRMSVCGMAKKMYNQILSDFK